MRAAVCKRITKNVDLGVLNVYLENLIFHLIGSGILNVVLQIFSVLHCIKSNKRQISKCSGEFICQNVSNSEKCEWVTTSKNFKNDVLKIALNQWNDRVRL